MQRKIIHIDLDCYYAAIEARDNSELRNIPMAIGRTNGRGVISTCNYEARAFGVRSAMPTAKALQLCPNLTVVAGNMKKYRQVSKQIHEIFGRYTSVIEPLSLDEAYLDVSDTKLFMGSATLIAEDIRQTIVRELKITASVGVSPLKFVSKVASDGRCCLNQLNFFQVLRSDPLWWQNGGDMGKANKKITNWAEYNKALCKRGSVTFWIDDSAINAWQCKPTMVSVVEASNTPIQPLKPL